MSFFQVSPQRADGRVVVLAYHAVVIDFLVVAGVFFMSFPHVLVVEAHFMGGEFTIVT